MKTIIGHVYSGGGPAGAYQASAMAEKATLEGLSYPDFAVGTSAGALNVLWLSQNQNVSFAEKMVQLERMYLETRRKHVWSYRFFGLFLDLIVSILPGFMRRWFNLKPPGFGLFSTQPLRKLIARRITTEPTKDMTEPFVVAVSRSTGRVKAFGLEDDLVTATMASSAFPGLTQPEEMEGEQWVDGGLRDVTPWSHAYAYWKANYPGTKLRLYIVSAHARRGILKELENWTVVSVLGRLLGIVTDEVADSDLVFPCEDPDVHIELLQPDLPLPAGVTDFSFKAVRETAEAGRRDSARGWRLVTGWR